MRQGRLALVAAVIVALALPMVAEARDPLVAPEGCSSTSRLNSCQTRSPAPVRSTDGPLTDTLPDGLLDPPKDPLGIDAAQPKPRAPLLTPAKDRHGVGTTDPLGVGK